MCLMPFTARSTSYRHSGPVAGMLEELVLTDQKLIPGMTKVKTRFSPHIIFCSQPLSVTAMLLRSMHLLSRARLCCLLIFTLTCLAFYLRKPQLLLTDLRFVPTACSSLGIGHKSMHNICKCPRSNQPLLVPAYQKESSCSEHATARGPDQRVVAYSFYGQVTSKYFNGTEVNIKSVARFYPGWVMRLYTNISLSDMEEVAVLCRLWCSNPHFDVCHVHQLPSPLCDKSEIFGMLWRFLVMGDPLVDRFVIRDLDSEIYQREIDAVQEWEKSGRTWHTMRDNPNHYLPMLGGMWGGRNQDLNITTAMRKQIISRGKRWKRGWDQDLLTQIVWPHASLDILEHDSYCCQKFNHSSPWPTRRIRYQFVGSTFPWDKEGQVPICPTLCRPRQHRDWLYC